MTFVVEHSGHGSLLQDLGRPGMGHLGVGASGAFDRGALRQVNALLGNDVGAAAVETYGGLVLRAQEPHVIAVAGAAGPVLIDGRPVTSGRATPVRAGQRLVIEPPTIGLRTYLGAAGGIAAPPELGSASSDTLSGLGPPLLAAGQILATAPSGPMPWLDDVPALGRSGDIVLDVVLGPRDDWFTPASVRRLLQDAWQVSPTSDRVGVRLEGTALERVVHHELPSEPVVRGSIQVSAAGQPMIFGPDHPVTGGYPVIAVVTDPHTDRLAQARPGQVVRFSRVG
ncbi:5-oxoprolinase subunit C family protein [Aeromicrobium wangtongii]|uniref:Biotin-dependent carboxyltransferase family protein n=1 Tax=Aeromicrobium wangtongii TaxID=2969247 RepID=A0ABY5M4L4_9ACTN|nr:biotin-dependent carboxyltransferase family protein [Aeromicrobium wangtongii]MCD9198842.1 biotin-dependent carboxyltransferase family protein [Aeromicrobium wangtongii]UUP13118.1 biotin-dependent carboxyltransferase family protein [Aeromicrobium wangtongii]